MSREVKFRAWLPIGQWNEEGTEQAFEMVYDIAFEEYEPLNDLLGRFDTLMQYTGLRDAKGREIWEGDILAVIGDQGYDHFGVVSWNDRKGAWESAGESGEDFHYFRVIGNKYEHSEMLENEDE